MGEENAYNGVSAVAKPIQMRYGMSSHPAAACVPVSSLPDTLDEWIKNMVVSCAEMNSNIMMTQSPTKMCARGDHGGLSSS